MPIVLVKRADGRAALIGSLPTTADRILPIDMNLSLGLNELVEDRFVKDWPPGVYPIPEAMAQEVFARHQP